VKGLLADANIQGQVDYLVQRMQADAWADFWQALGLALYRFEDVGLTASSTDPEVWNVCQAEQLIIITDNRNLDSEDSLEATIRRHNADVPRRWRDAGSRRTAGQRSGEHDWASSNMPRSRPALRGRIAR
jgi:predicted nuclease of predicted toxin-antitoxin system